MLFLPFNLQLVFRFLVYNWSHPYYENFFQIFSVGVGLSSINNVILVLS